jgi:hypothetical protein
MLTQTTAIETRNETVPDPGLMRRALKARMESHLRDYGFVARVTPQWIGVVIIEVIEPPRRDNLDVTMEVMAKAVAALGYRLLSYIEMGSHHGTYLTTIAMPVEGAHG